MHCARVSALIVLLVELVHSFSWDIVVGNNKQLEFYNNGTLTHTEEIESALHIHSVTYDPVHYRLLFTDYDDMNKTVSSFDLSTRKTQCLVTRTTRYYTRVAYDPVTQALFWREGLIMGSFSLNPSSNKTDGNVLLTLEHYCRDLAVDSCGRYIYWVTDYEIERARLDGSEREVLIKDKVDDRASLAIDQQTQRMYWTETIINGRYQVAIESASFNGKNRTTLYVVKNTQYSFSLAVSKDFIYWQNYNDQGIWQLPKYSSQPEARKQHSVSSSSCQYCNRIATNYTLEEQIEGVKSCDALQALIPNNSKSESTVSICQNYCFHGECSDSAEGHATCSCKAGYSGERCEIYACHQYCSNGGVCSLNEENKPVCQCTAGYDGERCDISICKDYCLHQGNCSVAAGSQPNCSCKAGYSGERCEVHACHKHCSNGGVCSLNEENKPVCQCTAGYDGERCDISICKDYCLHQGNCSVGAENQPDCSCKAGYSGKRCEVHACHKHCSNGGVCSLNEENKPVCQCTAGYDGERCDVSICKDYCLHQSNCSVGAENQPNCSCKAGYSGERCEVHACHKHCSNGGVCSLNEENKPVCQCTAGYDGERCDISICKDYCLHQGNCSVAAGSQPNCSCVTGFSGARCEVNVCQGYCLNGGVCSLNEEDEPACQCAEGYDGGRCEVPANNNSWDAGNPGEGTVSACHQFCLHDGVCSLNEAGEPVCRCSAAHEGDRCEAAVDKDLGFQLVATMLKGQPKVTVNVGRGVEWSRRALLLGSDSTGLVGDARETGSR